MYCICMSDKARSLISRVGILNFRASAIGTTTGLVFMLAIVFYIEMIKTEISFLIIWATLN